jgi:hypothetical protein
VLSTDQVAPPSRLSKTPGFSAPAKILPSVAVRPETFDSFIGPSP